MPACRRPLEKGRRPTPAACKPPAISKRELDREREETEILRARVLSLSEQLGAEQSRRERAERAARGPPSAADRSEDLRGRDALIAALQRQVDDDQHAIASLRTAAPLVVAPRGGAAPAKKSPLSPPPPPRDADGSQRASSASGSPDRDSHRSPPKENGELALVGTRTGRSPTTGSSSPNAAVVGG
ncbi:hypothetical protein DIPPA_33933 [Diplonema papillatum]|nr:hypothetical protein DIPPA_33933 [Diplonema papillatum]